MPSHSEADALAEAVCVVLDDHNQECCYCENPERAKSETPCPINQLSDALATYRARPPVDVKALLSATFGAGHWSDDDLEAARVVLRAAGVEVDDDGA